MTDFHVHIGQFGNVYYYADRVFAALKAGGVDEAWFSSTTSCVYCKESAAVQGDESLCERAPSARELYESVRAEMQGAMDAALGVGIKARPLYWVVPDIHFSKTACVSVERAMSDFMYDGFKLHPRAQNWNLLDGRISLLAQEVFSYAERFGKLVLIHCDEDFPPTFFEPLIESHPKALVQLAHSRPVDKTLYMLGVYRNVVCDTAMARRDIVERLRSEFAERVRFGSDFPTSHFRARSPHADPSEEELTEFTALSRRTRAGW